MKRFELSQDDFDLLLISLGAAVGALMPGNPAMAVRILELANTINKDNPAWIPYKTAAQA